MSTGYESAKKVALGLVREQKAQRGDDLWNVSFGDDFALRTEMPFQFFERGFTPTDALTAQKSALVLYTREFEADERNARKRFEELKRALAASDARKVTRLLKDAPPVQWLSLIFLDGQQVKAELVPLVEQSDAACKAALGAALDQALSQLVDFKDLIETLRSYC